MTDRHRGPSPEEMHALNASACAANDFEPFVGRMIRAEILDQVIKIGWVESGQSCRPAVGRIGYRLTAEGWEAFYNAKGSR